GEAAGVRALRVVEEGRAGDVLVGRGRTLGDAQHRCNQTARIDTNELRTDRLLVPDPVVGAEADGRRRRYAEGRRVDAAVRGARVGAVGRVADLGQARGRVRCRQRHGDTRRVPARRTGGAVAGDRARRRGRVRVDGEARRARDEARVVL